MEFAQDGVYPMMKNPKLKPTSKVKHGCFLDVLRFTHLRNGLKVISSFERLRTSSTSA